MMTDQAEPGDRQARAKQADAARQQAHRAVLDLVRQSGGRTVTRPMFRSRPNIGMTTTDAEPLAGILAARCLEHAAREFAREHVRRAREDGRTWHEIGAALGLGTDAHGGIPLAEAAYDDVAGDPDGEYARRYGRSFTWTCNACQCTIRDRGPCDGPADDEQGHADSCSRLADAIAAWEAQWDETVPGQ